MKSENRPTANMKNKTNVRYKSQSQSFHYFFNVFLIRVVGVVDCLQPKAINCEQTSLLIRERSNCLITN